mgnify:CR=1 FL=1|jgi:acyl-CoA hydrolase|tara:strand:- start:479 stop:928 length:450 start_codon:yes stop_codon:yes gene_type:complete
MKNVQSSLQKESHNQYRNRVGRTSRHQHLMSRGVDSSNRREEIKRFSEASARIEKKVQVEIADIAQSTTISRQKQISYDKARGAYESRTFLESTLRLKGIEPAESIEEMKAQYEDWKIRHSDGELPNKPRSPVTNSRTHHGRKPIEVAA